MIVFDVLKSCLCYPCDRCQRTTVQSMGHTVTAAPTASTLAPVTRLAVAPILVTVPGGTMPTPTTARPLSAPVPVTPISTAAGSEMAEIAATTNDLTFRARMDRLANVDAVERMFDSRRPPTPRPIAGESDG